MAGSLKPRHLQLEPLERRELLATWIGAGGGLWSTAANWDNGDVPNTAGETAVFNDGVAGGTVSVDAAYTIGSVTFANASVSYNLTGGSLALSGLSQTGAGTNVIDTTLDGSGGAFTGTVSAGSLQLNAANNFGTDDTFTVNAGATLQAVVSNANAGFGNANLVLDGGTLELLPGGSTTVNAFQETIFNRVVADAQNNIEAYRSATVGADDGRGMLFGHLNYPDDNSFSARAATLGAVGFDNGDFSALWLTNFTPNESGQWGFRFSGLDDNASLWVDTDQNGTFEAGNRFYSRPCCGGSGDQVTPALIAGQTYLFGIVMSDTGGGGNFTNMEVRSPSGAWQALNPSTPDLNGVFTQQSIPPGALSNAVSVTASSTIRLATGLPQAALGSLTTSDGVNLTVDSTSGNQPLAFSASATLGANTQVANNAMLTLNNVGGADLTKSGAGTLVLPTANTYTGQTTLAGGITRLGNNEALGAEAAGTVLQSGATLDIGGFRAGANGNEPIQVQGAGVGNNGAIINTGAAQTSAFRQMTLTGDTTFGGPNRWDLRDTGGAATFDGGGFKITKVGGNEVCLVNVVTSNLGDVDVNQGTFRIEGSTIYDAPGKTITVAGGATLDFWNNTQTHTPNVVLNNNGTVSANGGGGATLTGQITLAGGTDNLTANSNLTASGKITGGGNLVKNGGAVLSLTGTTNDYTGSTTVNAGTLRITDVNGLGNTSSTTVNAGGTLELSGPFAGPYVKPMTLSGPGAGNVGALNATNDDVTVQSTLTLVGAVGIGSGTAGKKLTLTQDLAFGPLGLTFTGAGDIDVLGNLSDGVVGSYAPGLVAGYLGGNMSFTANPGNAGVMLSPHAGLTNTSPPWADNRTWVYTGQFYDADGNFSFAENIDDIAWMSIDGVVRLNNGGWNTPTTTGPGPWGMGPNGDGWHNIEIRFSNGGGGAGAVAGNGWTATMGFGLNTDGTTSTDGSFYVAPVDPGDGSLFRVPAVGLSKTGTGTVTLLGAGDTYGSTTYISGGTLVATQSNSLGRTDAGTVVSGAGTLAITTSITGEDLSLDGLGAAGRYGALTNLSGDNTYDAPITGGASAVRMGIGSASGTLTLPQDIDLQYAQLVFDGPGDVLVDGVISGLSAPGQVNGLWHYGYHINNDGVVMDLNNNGGMVNGNPPNPAAFSSFYGQKLLTTGPGDRGLWYQNDQDFMNDGVIAPTQFDNYSDLFLGTLHVTGATAGLWHFRINQQDDPTGIWLDLDQDGVFESSTPGLGSNRGEQLAWSDTGDKTVTLAAGDYMVAFTHREGGGGSVIDARFRSPLMGAEAVVKPADPAQAGMFTVTLTPDNQVIKQGTGTVTLTADNTYSGVTTVRAGTLVVGRDDALGDGPAGTVIADGGTLLLPGGRNIATETLTARKLGTSGLDGVLLSEGDNTVSSAITLQDNGLVIRQAAGGVLTLGSAIDMRSSSLTFDALGDILSTGAITSLAYSPGLTEDLLPNYQNNSAAPGTGNVYLLPRAGEQSRNGATIWGDNQTWVYSGQFYVPAGVTTVAFAGNIDDAWIMRFNGVVVHNWAWGGQTGAISVTPDTWYDIELRFSNGGGGAGAAGGDNWAGSLPDILTYPNPPWQKGFGYAFNPADPNTHDANSYVVPIDSGAMNLLRVASTNALVKTGGATLTLSGDSDYVAPTQIDAGTVILESDNGLGAAAGDTTVADGAMLLLPGAITSPEPVAVNGTGIGGGGALRSQGGSNAIGPITVATAATIMSADVGGTLSINGTVTGAATLTFDGPGNTDVNGAMTDQALAGLQEGVLSGNQSAAAQPANSGIYLLPRAGEQFANPSNNPPGTVWTYDNITLVYTGQFYVPEGVTTVAFAGSIDDSWRMWFDGTLVRDWVWLGSTGAISVTPDTWYDVEIRFANGGGGAGASGNGWGGTGSLPAPYNAAPWAKGFGYALNPGNPASTNQADYVPAIDDGSKNVFRSGSEVLSVVKTGAGTLRLNAASDYTGPTTVNEGLLQNGANDAVSPVSDVTVAAGAVWDLNGYQNADKSLTLSSGNPAGSLVTTGAGTLTLNGNVTVNGAPGDTAGAVIDGQVHLSNAPHTFDVADGGALTDLVINATVSGTALVTFGGLDGRYYSVTADPALLDPASGENIGLEALAPSVTLFTPSIDFGAGTETVPGDGTNLARDGTDGNPYGGIGVNVGNDNIAGLWTGFLNAPETADYQFTTRSDDGSRIWVDINNDGDFADANELVADRNFFTGMGDTTGPVVTLTAGLHAIEIAMYEGGGGAGMQASWQQLTGTTFPRRIIGGSDVAMATVNELMKSGDGVLALTASNTYDGQTQVLEGVLAIAANSALGTADGGTTVADGATLSLAGGVNYSTPEPLTLNGAGAGGMGALLSYSGDNSFAGPITLASASTILSASAGETLTLGASITGGATVTFDGPGNTTVNGPLVQIAQAGLLEGVLAGNQNNGAQPGNAGAYLLPRAGEQFANPSNNPPGTVWAFDNITLVYTGQFYVPAGVTTVGFAGSIDDSWRMWFDGALVHDWGWLGHTGAISVTPDTWYDVEIRFANGGGGAGASGNGWGGALPAPYNAAPWAKGFGYALNPANPDSENQADYLVPIDNGSMNLLRTGPELLSVVKNGAGTLRLNATSNYTGATTVSGGRLENGADDAVGPGSAVTLAAGTVWDLRGFDNANPALTLSSGNPAGSLVDNTGSGTLILNGDVTVNTTAGDTAGAVVNGNVALGSAPHTFTVNPPLADALTLNGPISSASQSLTFTGPGSTTLNGDVSLTGMLPWDTVTITEIGGGTLTMAGIDMGLANLDIGGAGDILVSGAILGGSAQSVDGFDERIFNRVAGDAQGDIEAYRAATLGPDDGRGVLTGPLNYPNDQAFSDRAAALGAVGFDSENFSALWLASFAPNESGSWGFRFANLDDNASFWIDTSQNNVFEAGERFYNRGCCGASGDQFTPALTAGQTYLFGIPMSDTGGGGNFTNVEVKSPSGAWQALNPSAPGLAGLFTTSVTPENNLTKFGAGTVTLGGADTYGGLTTVSEGMLVAANATALGGAALGTTVADGATLAFSGNINYLAPEAVAVEGAGVGGAGVVRNLSGNNAFAGPITAVYKINGNVTFGSSAGTLTLGGAVNLHASSLHVVGAGNMVISGTITAVTPSSSNYVNQLLGDPSLKAYYRFEEPVGSTTAVDSSDSHIDGTYLSGAGDGLESTSVYPALSNALTFDGVDDQVQLTGAASLGLNGNFTATAWIRADDLSVDRTILGTDQTGDNIGLHLIIRGTRLYMGFYGNDLGGNQVLNAGQWYHVAFRFNNGEQAIFIDGVQDAAGGGHAAFAGTDVVRIGRWAGGNYFNGAMDEVAIVGRALSNAEIQDLYNAGPNTTSGIVPPALHKSDAGTLTLAAANVYPGGTTVDGGTLLVTNTTGSGTGQGLVIVAGGATLGGTGNVAGSVTVQSGGTVSPGMSPGRLSVGDAASTGVEFAAGSTFRAELNGPAPGSGYDQLSVRGTVSLGNSTLVLSRTYPYSVSDPAIVLVDNDGADAVAGTFAGLPEGAKINVDGAPFTISYQGGDGNDVVLIRVPVTPGQVVIDAGVNDATDDAMAANGSQARLQHSMITRITVTFTGVVTWDPGAFVVQRLGSGGGNVNLSVTQQDVGGVSIVTIGFAGGSPYVYARNGGGFALNDGNYQFQVDGTKVHDAGGSLAANRVDNFFRFFGDTDGDRDVDGTDLYALQRVLANDPRYLKFKAALDYFGDGLVDAVIDYNQFRLRYGKRLLP